MFLALIKIATKVNLLVVFRAVVFHAQCAWNGNKQCARNGNKQYFGLWYSMRSVYGMEINSVREMEINGMS